MSFFPNVSGPTAALAALAYAPRQNATAGDGNGCCATAMKIAAYAIIAIAAIAGVIFLGPLVGIGIAAVLAVGALGCWLCRCCGGNSRGTAAGVPLSQRSTSWIPAHPHVRVGAGHFQTPIPVTVAAPRVLVGGGPATGPHVPVGGGPFRTPTPVPVAVPRAPVGRGPAAGPHVPVGGGPGSVPVGQRRDDRRAGPSGPVSHVPVGHRRGR
jgi:hypothetical protein